jgi:hypothetical protein
MAPLPRIAVSKKLLVLATVAVVVLGGAVASAVAFWPAEPEQPRTPVQRPKKARRPAPAASAASPASAAPAMAASVPAPAPVASAPESPMDRLQRRLAETLGRNGTVEAGGGELKLTTRRPLQTVKESD